MVEFGLIGSFDGELGRVVAAFPTPPNVLIVSDHGHEADVMSRVWRGRHAADGIFLAAGPDIRQGGSVEASYLDVFPTVLSLLRLPIPPEQPGRALLTAAEGQ